MFPAPPGAPSGPFVPWGFMPEDYRSTRVRAPARNRTAQLNQGEQHQAATAAGTLARIFVSSDCLVIDGRSQSPGRPHAVQTATRPADPKISARKPFTSVIVFGGVMCFHVLRLRKDAQTNVLRLASSNAHGDASERRRCAQGHSGERPFDTPREHPETENRWNPCGDGVWDALTTAGDVEPKPFQSNPHADDGLWDRTNSNLNPAQRRRPSGRARRCADLSRLSVCSWS